MVPRYSCYNCTKLTKVTLGKNIKNLGNSCFSDCTNLTTIIGGENLQIVNDYAFYNNPNLTNISGLDVSKLTHIGDYAFFSTKLFPSFTKDGIINLDNIIGLKGTPFDLDPSNIPNNIKHITLKLGKNLNNIINNNNGYSNIFEVNGDSESSIKYSIELNPENKYLTLNKYDGY
jgi:surface antigen bspA-like